MVFYFQVFLLGKFLGLLGDTLKVRSSGKTINECFVCIWAESIFEFNVHVRAKYFLGRAVLLRVNYYLFQLKTSLEQLLFVQLLRPNFF